MQSPNGSATESPPDILTRRKELQRQLLDQVPLASSLRQEGKEKEVRNRHRRHRLNIRQLLKEMEDTY
jgi:hypothetical protein